MGVARAADPGLRRIVGVVALLNLAYFGVEFAVATAIGSVSLFADSVDFLEDASVNLLILIALAWTAKNRARVGMALAAILLVPGLATLWTAWEKFNAPVAPDPLPLSLAGLGALAVGLDLAEAGWRPTVENYLGRVTKGRILEAVREAKGEQAAQLIDHLKKPEMAKEAERLLADTGWLPEPLRTPGDPEPEADPAEADASGSDEIAPLPAFLTNEGEPAVEPEAIPAE